LLPRLTVNRQFLYEFLEAEALCFALALAEEGNRQGGFLALRPGERIPPEILDAGFSFGHRLLGNAAFEVAQFSFHFYGFKTYHALVNPNHLIVRTVFNSMIENQDYFFFALDATGCATAFRSELGQTNLCGLETNLPRIQRSTTTEAQYREAISSFGRNPQPPGLLLPWVCRDDVAYLDLTEDRLELTPAPRQTVQ
jgi:hypothetical protein